LNREGQAKRQFRSPSFSLRIFAASRFKSLRQNEGAL
jgi:hypothetical protein